MNDFERSLVESASLPTLPSIAQRLLGLLHGDGGISELTDAIGVDPAITAKLLKLVNSPMYGVSGEISSLHEALAHLGLNTVRSIALSFSFAHGLRSEEREQELDGLWRSSLMTALAARRLAAETRRWDGEQAFFAGLLADCGALVMYEALPEHRGLVARFQQGEGDLLELERGALESDHARLGSLLLEAWNFPDELCRVIAHHHAKRPADDSAIARRVQLLDGAWMCARALCVEGFKHEVTRVGVALAEHAEVSPLFAERLLAELPGELREIARAFEIPFGEQKSYSALLQEASETLRGIAIEADRSAYGYAAATGGGRSGFDDIRQALTPTLGVEDSTRLLHRRSMERLLEAFYVRAEQRRCALGLMVIEFEESKGEVGEDPECVVEVLASATRMLRQLVRDEDDIARFGPRQLAIVMPDCEGDNLLAAGRRIRKQLEDGQLEFEGEPARLVIGLAHVLPHASRSDFSELVESAAAALERARVDEDRLSR